MKKAELNPTEFNEYYGRYIHKLEDDAELISSYESGKATVVDFFKSIPKEKLDYRYAFGKWTPKELLQHLIDTERIFMYRCLRIARNDTTPLAGFDQNTYIEPSRVGAKNIDDLLDEFTINRENSIIFLRSLSDDDLLFVGTASGNELSARAAAFIIPGHDMWHIEIIKERYL